MCVSCALRSKADRNGEDMQKIFCMFRIFMREYRMSDPKDGYTRGYF